MDHPIQAIRPDLFLVIKKIIYQLNKFTVPADQAVKIKESKKIEKIVGPCLRTKNIVEHDGDSIIHHSWSTWNNFKEPRKEIVGIGDQRNN